MLVDTVHLNSFFVQHKPR